MGADPLDHPIRAAVGAFLAIDARRPASWMAAAAGAAAGIGCGAWPGDATGGVAVAVMAAAATATAAIGDLPLSLLTAPVLHARRGRRQVLAWAIERASWGAAGFVLGAGLAAPAPRIPPLAAAAFCSAAAAALTLAGARLSGAPPADAAALAIVLAAPAAAAAATCRSSVAAGLTAAATWGVLAAGAWLWSRGRSAGDAAREFAPLPAAAEPPAEWTAAAWRDTLLPAGGAGRVLEWIAMTTALVAMAIWLVLDAGSAGLGGHAAAWAGFTAVWFVALAVPAMALGEGVGDAGEKTWLCDTAAVVAAPRSGWLRSRPAAVWLRPGRVRFAASAGLTTAAVLGWPPLVGALVALPDPARSLPAVLIVAGLAGAVMVTTAVVGASIRAGVARETVFAALLGAAACAGVWLANPRSRSNATIRIPHEPEGLFPADAADCLPCPVASPSRLGLPSGIHPLAIRVDATGGHLRHFRPRVAPRSWR